MAPVTGLVAGDGQGVAGVVIEPGEDLGVAAIGEGPLGEVGLPGFVGLLGLEADVGRLGSLRRGRCDQVGAADGAVDRGSRHRYPVVVLEVPADRVRARVESLGDKFAAEFEDQLDRRDGVACGCVSGRRERGSNAASPSAR